MSVRQVKAWTITCAAAYGNGVPGSPVKCTNRNLGPFFAEYESGVPLPAGWGYRTAYDCGLTGYTRRDLFCADCIKRAGIEVDARA